MKTKHSLHVDPYDNNNIVPVPSENPNICFGCLAGRI